MAANFAFYPQSITTWFTVGVTTATFTASLQRNAGTGTVSISAGIYQTQGCRIANLGTVHVHVNFTTLGSDPVLTSANGIPILSGTVETFRMQGLPVLQMLCPGATSTIAITFGEGL